MDDSQVERLTDFAERPRTDDWSLRSAVVRYAQVAPQRASVVLELIRRTDGALKHLAKHPERAETDDAKLLDVAAMLDDIGDTLATWAIERGDPPHEKVETIGRRAATALGNLGIPRETRDGRRPPGQRRG